MLLEGEDEDDRSNFVVWFQDAVEDNTGHTIHFEQAVLSVALGSMDNLECSPIAVFGLEDGRIIVSLLPIPLRQLDPATALPSPMKGFDLNTHRYVYRYV